ncbi:MAG: PIN domain-containing protein [Oligoflexales bacterium]|nr:PIN domain-containing protein [Oligoflexales bacterium]
MILLDSCCVLEILLDGPSARHLSKFLDKEQDKGNVIHLSRLVRLETSAVAAVRYKERRFPVSLTLDAILAAIDRLPCDMSADELSRSLIEEAARIKSEHAASMVDCYLLAYAHEFHAEILTADKEILTYMQHRAKSRSVAGHFAAVLWR